MYVLGHGVRRNYTEAVIWFKIAAAKGVDDAALALMRSWMVGMPGETVSCNGCHEHQNGGCHCHG